MNQVQTTVEPPAPMEVSALLGIIQRVSENPNVDIDKIERMMSMYERMLTNARLVAIEEAFSEAFAKAQAAMKPIVADAKNDQTHSKYASQAAIDIGIRDIYTAHGFSLSFDTEPSAVAEMINIVARLRHTRGYFKDYRLPMPADGKGAKGGDVMTKTHATGSALTYGQRNLTKMIWNIAVSRDDDGNAAGKVQETGEVISKEQLDRLVALCDDLGADKQQFCQYLKVPSLADIPKHLYAKALNVLAARSAQRAKAKREEPA